MSNTLRSFQYKSRDSRGKIVKGKLDAATDGAVVSKLRSMGLSPIQVKEATAGTGLQREISFGATSKSIGLKDLAVMSRQMSTMTSAGLSLL
ncbi:MAG: type secretion system family protein, partial [Microbacteriaceae bacterium]|nr:type secretion system family protein [Microbacteriaceae bacterium]